MECGAKIQVVNLMVLKVVEYNKGFLQTGIGKDY